MSEQVENTDKQAEVTKEEQLEKCLGEAIVLEKDKPNYTGRRSVKCRCNKGNFHTNDTLEVYRGDERIDVTHTLLLQENGRSVGALMYGAMFGYSSFDLIAPFSVDIQPGDRVVVLRRNDEKNRRPPTSWGKTPGDLVKPVDYPVVISPEEAPPKEEFTRTSGSLDGIVIELPKVGIQAIDPKTVESFKVSCSRVMQKCYQQADESGFWQKDRNEAECIALMHSELSEALEALRHGNPKSEHIPEFFAVEEEFADLIIRVFDLAYKRCYHLPEAIIAKMNFNATREYKHGKKF